MHGRKIDPSARNRVENAHQCALRVAIPDMKDLHVGFLVTISDSLYLAIAQFGDWKPERLGLSITQ
jgi:hypothetical protein